LTTREHSFQPRVIRQGVVLGKGIVSCEKSEATIALNSGTLPTRNNSPGYRDDARIPKSDWRSPTPEEMRILCVTSSAVDVPCVEIVLADSEVLCLSAKAFARVTWSNSTTDLSTTVDSSAYRELMVAMLECAGRLGKVLKDPLVRISAPDLSTITLNKDLFIGLHVDEWFHDRHSSRRQRPNRMVFNLGTQPRYFMFINIPVEEMTNRIPVGLQIPSSSEGTAIGLRFMECYPDYPVCRIRVQPGEAYIAPTENLVHDASSAGITRVDIAGHILGHFGLATTFEIPSEPEEQ
jgi:hypothetical protein